LDKGAFQTNIMTTSIKTQFDLQTRLFNNVTEGVTDEQANTRYDDSTNPIIWIAGHLLNTRVNGLQRIIGGQPDESLVPFFGRGHSYSPDVKYPGIDEIRSRWQEVSPVVSEGLGHVPAEVLAAKGPFQPPVADDTVAGVLAFLMSHESYHIGQISLLRKLAGKEAMSYM
jgi:DinB superfamily